MPTTVFADSPRNGGLGDRPYAILDLAGPASYVQLATGSPPTGGQPVDNTTFGLGSALEAIQPVSLSSDGQYSVEAVPLTSNPGGPTVKWTLVWVVFATGAQVGAGVNLSGVTVRLMAFGPY